MAVFEPSPEHESAETDLARTVLRGLIALVPAGTEMFNALVGPSYNRRLEEWKAEVAENIRQAAQAGRIDIETLPQNDAFIDVVAKATMIAMTTSQQRKRAALRAAVMNSALPGGPDQTQQQVFLALTDRFTEAHLTMLAIFNDPVRHASGVSINTGIQLFEHAVPAARASRPLYDGVWRDLHVSGLVTTPSIDNGPEGGPGHIRRITELGKRYIAFITLPTGS